MGYLNLQVNLLNNQDPAMATSPEGKELACRIITMTAEHFSLSPLLIKTQDANLKANDLTLQRKRIRKVSALLDSIPH